MTAFCRNHRTAPSAIVALLLLGVISGALWGCDMYALDNSAKDPDAWQGASASFVLNEAKRLVPWAIANDSAIAAASRESGQGSFFEISSSIPLYWIAKGQVEQVRSDDLFVIYQNGTPIAWLFVPSEEERAKTNTDGNYSRVASLGIHDSVCPEIRGTYAVVRMSESCRIRFNELERELADSEWILDSEGQWFLIGIYNEAGFEEELPKEWEGIANEPFSNPLNLSKEEIASIKLSSAEPLTRFEVS